MTEIPMPRGGLRRLHGRCTQHGFTLIELMVMIVILSLVAAMIAPRLPSTRSARLRTAARSVASVIRYMEDRAMTVKEGYQLRFDISGGDLAVTRRKAGGDTTHPEDPFLGKRILSEGVIIEDVSTSRLGKVGEGEVVMNVGASGLEDFLIVHLKESGGDRFTIMAYPYGGKIKLLAGYQETEP